MELSYKELWTVLHGMGFGAVYLLAFAGALDELYSDSRYLQTPEGIRRQTRRLQIGTGLMALIAWATVISGTWVVYIWYRMPPGAAADLINYPRSLLLSKPETKEWHEFGMEWKEHVAWLVPMIATSIAYSIYYYGERLAVSKNIRRILLILLAASFSAAGVAALFGAFINKIAATR